MGPTTEIRSLIMYFVNGLLARRWTILVAAWFVCILGWFFVAMLPNSFTSHARIYVDTQSLLRLIIVQTFNYIAYINTRKTDTFWYE